MQKHFSTAATIFVALLFVSGTVGCQNTGGAWYNPKSYAWSNPFARGSVPSLFSSASKENTKPSLESYPNIDVPQGGYSQNSYASRPAGSPAGTSADWGQPNPVASQFSSNPYGTYSEAVPSSYPPQYMVDGSRQSPYGGQGVVPSSYNYPSTAQNHNPYQYPQNTAQQGTSMPATHDYATSQYQPTAGHAPLYNQDTNTAGNYMPWGTTPESDPYSSSNRQPSSYNAPGTPPAGYGSYDIHTPSPPPYTDGGVASPYSAYPPPSSGFGSY